MKNGDMPSNPVSPNSNNPSVNGGMTKRELMAMHAMSAMLSSKYVSDFSKDGSDDQLADEMYSGLSVEAVSYADALLKELDKPVREG